MHFYGREKCKCRLTVSINISVESTVGENKFIFTVGRSVSVGSL